MTYAIAGAWLQRAGDVEDRLDVRVGKTYFNLLGQWNLREKHIHSQHIRCSVLWRWSIVWCLVPIGTVILNVLFKEYSTGKICKNNIGIFIIHMLMIMKWFQSWQQLWICVARNFSQVYLRNDENKISIQISLWRNAIGAFLKYKILWIQMVFGG